MVMSDLDQRGKRLWKSLLAHDATLGDALTPLREVALAACFAADRVDRLERLARTVPAVSEGKSGEVMHPVFAEVRQQEAILARLITALRLPDETSGKRPARAPLRGVQKPSAVSSLDRARGIAGA